MMRFARPAMGLVTLLTLSSVGLISCGGGGSSDADGVSVGQGGPDELFAETASFEVVAGKPQRVMVGLSTADGRVLQGGSVRFVFRSVDGGSDSTDTASATGPASAADTVEATAAFLPVPGAASPAGAARIGRPSAGIGVYAAAGVTVPHPGVWTIEVRSAGSGGKQLAQTAVEVVATARVPDIGRPAPPTDNPTAASGVARELLDSRSGPNGMGSELPDPSLHRDVINDLLRDKKPFVVVASTPAYCQSRFCGPVTDLVDTIANEPASKARGVAFVHLEVFARFGGAGASVLNPWVIPWIDGNGDGHEPWIFVVDRSGRIATRFDNLVDEKLLRAAVAAVGVQP